MWSATEGDLAVALERNRPPSLSLPLAAGRRLIPERGMNIHLKW